MNTTSTFRAFFAVNLGDLSLKGAKSAIETLQNTQGFESVRWVLPPNLHITLRFLGDVQALQIKDLVSILEPTLGALPSFNLEFGTQLKAFPHHHPHVLISEVLPSLALTQVWEIIEKGVLAVGLPPEKRGFHPHLTLGRFNRINLSIINGLGGFHLSDSEIKEIVLYHSQNTPHGVSYVPLKVFKLL